MSNEERSAEAQVCNFRLIFRASSDGRLVVGSRRANDCTLSRAARGGTVLSEIGFPLCAVGSKFAPHFRQGLFSPLAKFEIAFRYKLVSLKVLRRNC
jgi:hypothetical protein